MKKRLGALLVLLVIVLPPGTSRVDATSPKTYTIHGAATDSYPRLAAGLKIRNTVHFQIHLMAKRGLPADQAGLWSISIEQNPSGLLVAMGSGFEYGGTLPTNKTLITLDRTQCPAICLVYVYSQNIDWSVTMGPSSAISMFITPRMLGLK